MVEQGQANSPKASWTCKWIKDLGQSNGWMIHRFMPDWLTLAHIFSRFSLVKPQYGIRIWRRWRVEPYAAFAHPHICTNYRAVRIAHGCSIASRLSAVTYLPGCRCPQLMRRCYCCLPCFADSFFAWPFRCRSLQMSKRWLVLAI